MSSVGNLQLFDGKLELSARLLC